MKKSVSEISPVQFEYLCAAYLENDLKPEQKSELLEIISLDAEKKRTFELIQKTRLSPIKLIYKNKRNLLHSSPFEIFTRLSVIGLSTAAAVILMISLFRMDPDDPALIINNTAHINAGNPNIQVNSPGIKNEIKAIADNSVTADEKRSGVHSGSLKEADIIAMTEPKADASDDSLMRVDNSREPGINRINFNAEIVLREEIPSGTLLAYNISPFNIPEEDNGRTDIGRFISKTFREKILRQNNTSDTPLKGYEIAEAGVSGLNKILGWEMALDKNSDDNGELNSVYFSSRLLKFNSPVKKNEIVP